MAVVHGELCIEQPYPVRRPARSQRREAGLAVAAAPPELGVLLVPGLMARKAS